MKWKIGTLLVVGVATIVVGLSMFVTGYWSTGISESASAVAAVSESEGDGLQDGIKVRGHYELEVRDPDGTLVASTSFSNALRSGAVESITKALYGYSGQFPGWALSLHGTPNPCESLCEMRAGGTQYTEPERVQNSLSVGFQSAAGRITLTGSYLAGDPPGEPTGGTLTTIRAWNRVNAMESLFSEAALPSGITYTKGQTINVTYTLSVN